MLNLTREYVCKSCIGHRLRGAFDLTSLLATHLYACRGESSIASYPTLKPLSLSSSTDLLCSRSLYLAAYAVDGDADIRKGCSGI